MDAAVLKFPCTGRRFLVTFPFPRRDFFHHAGVFPVIFPFPTLQYIPGKLLFLLMKGIRAYLMEKNAAGVSKNILLGNYVLRRM
jgi:hypothetical protein